MATNCIDQSCREGCCDYVGLCPSKTGRNCSYFYDPLKGPISTNGIVGVVVGVFVLLVLGLIIAFAWYRKCKAEEAIEAAEKLATDNP